MDLEKRYYLTDGTECNIVQLVKKEPEWAANKIQTGEKAIAWVNNLPDAEEIFNFLDQLTDELKLTINVGQGRHIAKAITKRIGRKQGDEDQQRRE